MGPLVSICVNNFNYERFLAAAVDSALAQMYDRVEVIVVDDGSTDGSRDVIASYGDRVQAVLKPNGGQASAINAGYEAGSGDVFMFLDADDVLEPSAAAEVAAVFERDPDTAMAMFRLRIVNAEGRDTGRQRPRRPKVMPEGDLRGHIARYRCFHWQPTSGNAFSAAALARVMPVPAEYRISADAYLAAVVPLCGPVHSLDAVLGSYRVHGGGNYSSAPIDAAYFRRQIDGVLAAHRQMTRLAAELGVSIPADPERPLDAAYLGFRMSSLLLDPEHHPFPGDTRRRLAARGIRASLGNPKLAWPNRLRRAAWFAVCAVAGPSRTPALTGRWAPDTPARRSAIVQGSSAAGGD